MLISKKGPEV